MSSSCDYEEIHPYDESMRNFSEESSDESEKFF